MAEGGKGKEGFSPTRVKEAVAAGLIVAAVAGVVGYLLRQQIGCVISSSCGVAANSTAKPTNTATATTVPSTPMMTPAPPALTSVTAERPTETIQNLGPYGIHNWIQFASLRGNVGLAGHVLRAMDAGAPVTFIETGGLGDLVDSGHGIRIGLDAVGYAQFHLANQTGGTGVTIVTVDGVTAFTCPPTRDPYNRDVSCSAP